MATVGTTGDKAAGLLQTLSLDSQNKTIDTPEPTKNPSVDYGGATNGQIQSCDRSLTPLLTDFIDPTMCYVPSGYPSPAYYYGGYDGSGHEWDDYSRYVNPDGVEMTPGVYGENGSLMYHHSYGYAPYGPYSPAASPVPTVGHDGQLYGAQHYQYPAPYFQPMTPSTGPYSITAAPPKGEISTSRAADQAPLSMEAGNGNGNANGGGAKRNNGSAQLRSAYSNSSFNANGSYGRGAMPGGFSTSGYQDPRFSFDGIQSPIPWLDGPIFSDAQHRLVSSSALTSSVPTGNGVSASRNQNLQPNSYLMGLHHPKPMSGISTANGYMNRMYPNKLYGQFGNNLRPGFGYGSNVYDSRASGHGWLAMDNKFKPRGRGSGLFGYSYENMDGLNELNRGPRAKSFKNQKGFAPAAVAVQGQNIPLTGANDGEKKSNVISDREQYNRRDFLENYTDAKFFVIKSYSEDDVHKSIKYNVWASTPNGNKKLDAAYQESKQKSCECPVFLFFSVNTSGQFVGVAEMVGPVDFSKNVEYWQQDKWIGCFPVKWQIVKDVPNSLLKHIILENNENKPVTNSRDTQEVKLEQGLQILKIFKEHSSRQCILDDFDFYEDREKRIHEKKAKQQQFQKQVWEGKHMDEKNKEGADSVLKPQKSSDVTVELVKESAPAVQMNGNVKITENGYVGKSVDVPKAAKPVPLSENILTNDVVNGY